MHCVIISVCHCCMYNCIQCKYITILYNNISYIYHSSFFIIFCVYLLLFLCYSFFYRLFQLNKKKKEKQTKTIIIIISQMRKQYTHFTVFLSSLQYIINNLKVCILSGCDNMINIQRHRCASDFMSWDGEIKLRKFNI